MNLYYIIISDEAMEDIDSIVDYIHSELKEAFTAQQYYDGVIHTIQKLSFCAGSIGFNTYVQSMFGKKARHINYKKTAIIYIISKDVVYITRIIASSLIH
ncbi:MAG: type II toxin-antitoxin system RelE/ParE family toxin [Candidatus Symbiothrix sp.]|jgi:plasmid stabilization system protein ParE|nr:type II toxin-antitoxin system RelE/ParE family toxin [Candidatus Symbiothrix sp.]